MDRRGFISGITSLLVAPAIVRAGSLMAIKPIKPFSPSGWGKWVYIQLPLPGFEYTAEKRLKIIKAVIRRHAADGAFVGPEIVLA